MAYIELVIKIPEEMYKWVDDVNKFFNYYGTSDFVDLVKKGTPLPKKHGRLMDADTFINSLKSIERLHIDDELRINILDYINSNILVESEISR